MFKKYFIIVFCLLMTLASASFAKWQEFSYEAMTTPIKLVFWFEDDQQAEKISHKVFKAFDDVEQQMSRYIDSSELTNINQQAFEGAVSVSPSLFSVLNSAMNISKLSQGAFDMTFASVGYMYDFRQHIKPGEQEIQQNIDLVDYQNVHLDHEKQAVSVSKQGVVIDLGGIAKGYAVDQGITILKKYDVASAHLSAGGDMRLLGDKRGAPWIIGIKNPRDKLKQSIVLPLTDTAISTSGDYERFFMDEQGERVHHILSPKTGEPVKGMMSVTVLASDAVTSDGLSTAVFVLGVTEGLKLINRLKGIDAILIDEYGKVHFSKGLMRPNVP